MQLRPHHTMQDYFQTVKAASHHTALFPTSQGRITPYSAVFEQLRPHQTVQDYFQTFKAASHLTRQFSTT